MNQHAPFESVSWRLIFVRSGAPEVLLFKAGSAWRLPVVELPDQSRIAMGINARVKALWGMDAVSLYHLQLEGYPSSQLYHVAELLPSDACTPQSARWISGSELSRDAFEQASDFAAVERWLRRFEAPATGRPQSPFETPGWFPVAREMARQSAEESSLALSGRFVQLNASASFSLIRFETNREAVWFKAVGEPNLREFDLMPVLSVRFPEFVPRLLRTKPEWHAWTMLELSGVPLSRSLGHSGWFAAARDLARMQIESITATRKVLECHARDIRVQALLNQVKPFFEVMRELMRCQTAALPVPLSDAELYDLELDTREMLLDFSSQGIPDTIGHLDLNPDNIITTPGGTLFLDWAEACVGHPFLSFCYLLEFFSQRFPGNGGSRSLLIRSYLEPWQAAGVVQDASAILAVCIPLAIFAHAVSTDLWRDSPQRQKPQLAGYYRSLVRRMKRCRDRSREGAELLA